MRTRYLDMGRDGTVSSNRFMSTFFRVRDSAVRSRMSYEPFLKADPHVDQPFVSPQPAHFSSPACDPTNRQCGPSDEGVNERVLSKYRTGIEFGPSTLGNECPPRWSK